MVFQVKHLEDIAIEQLFHQVVTQLLPVINESLCCLRDSPKSPTLDNIIDNIRKYLDEYLVGDVYSKVRSKLVNNFQWFYSAICKNNSPSSPAQLYQVFVDCFVDDSFKEFDVTPSELCQSSSIIIETLARRCKRLETLHWTSVSPRLPFTTAHQLLGCFTYLTKLKLSWDDVTFPDSTLFLSTLGESCPNLKKLNIKSLPVGIPQLFALMFGPRLDFIRQSWRVENEQVRSELHKYQFTNESLTPVCSSLQKLKVNWVDWEDDCMWDNSSTVAFVLRHFPQLRNLSECCHQHVNFASSAVRLLYKTQFDDTTETTTHTLGSIKWTVNAPFSGTFNLMELESVDIHNRDMMKAVVSLCPRLKTIEFDSSSHGSLKEEDVITPDELDSVVKAEQSAWPKVQVVTITRTLAAYRHILLAKIGAKLSQLCMIGCELIDVTKDLKPCSQLKRLVIRESCTMAPIEAAASTIQMTTDRLLPNLVSLTSWICLGDSSHLFETDERHSLKRLTLYCPHISLPSVSKWNWSDVPKLWSNVDELRLYYTKGLKLETLRQMALKMKNLISITVPSAIITTEKDKKAAEVLKKELNNLQVHLHFSVNPISDCLCHYHHRF